MNINTINTNFCSPSPAQLHATTSVVCRRHFGLRVGSVRKGNASYHTASVPVLVARIVKRKTGWRQTICGVYTFHEMRTALS